MSALDSFMAEFDEEKKNNICHWNETNKIITIEKF